MAYWITTHWPPREDDESEEGSGVWLPDGRHNIGVRIAVDDMLFVYESLSGRTVLRELANGKSQRVHCRHGKEGIVHLSRISAPISADPASRPESYSDGTTIWWRWYAPANILTRSGFVPRQEVAEILGYKRNYNFRGFGQEHSGLREISESQFNALLNQFAAARPLTLPQRSVPRAAKGGLGGGESIEHKQLKEFVASDPVAALSETGLRTIKVEYAFPTGDRADIVLADKYNRIIGVEIEPNVDDADEIGVLQAIKYRRMLEWSANRAFGDSRSILVAYRISSKMKKRCANYEVECFEVPRSRLTEH